MANNEIVYDLRTGYPDTQALVPHEKLAQITQELLLSDRASQYGGDLLGIIQVRQAVAQHVTQYTGDTVTPDDLLISNGAIHGIDLFCRTVTEPGDIILMESPTFFFMFNVFRKSHIEIVTVPMTPTGIDLTALEDVLKQHGKRVKMLYTIASYHNPTGLTMTADHRQALVELAHRYDFKIIEDATYQWLYYNDSPPPLLRHYDPDGSHVSTAGTFSKVVMPSLRQGWIWSTPEMGKAMSVGKGDASTSRLTSLVITEFIQRGFIDSQIEHARTVYGSRCNALCDTLEACLPDWVQWTRPEGGYFVWLELPENLTSADVRTLANNRQTDFLPGDIMFWGGAPDRYLRLCFALLDEKHLTRGAEILSESIRQADKR